MRLTGVSRTVARTPEASVEVATFCRSGGLIFTGQVEGSPLPRDEPPHERGSAHVLPGISLLLFPTRRNHLESVFDFDAVDCRNDPPERRVVCSRFRVGIADL